MNPNNSPKTRVLLVDDDVTLLDMYKERLIAAGYEIITASNGEEALSKAVETIPHVILMDVMMPKVNGFDALNILKDTKETKDIPVIILTALTQDTHRQKGMSDGASDYAVKSEVMPKEVVEKIEKVVSERKKKIEQLSQ